MNTVIQTKQDLLRILTDHRAQIKALGVRRLGLFGSFVRDTPHETSDVDLLVEFESGQKTFDHFMRLSFLLEDLLQRRVELVTPAGLSPYIRPYILQEVEYVAFPPCVPAPHSGGDPVSPGHGSGVESIAI
jgi:predicted nucleotidyltransferase